MSFRRLNLPFPASRAIADCVGRSPDRNLFTAVIGVHACMIHTRYHHVLLARIAPCSRSRRGPAGLHEKSERVGITPD